MSENINELFELEELKATYKLMDERLDNQEIVSNEQLRETMVRKFTDMRQNLKEGIIWGNLLFVPIIGMVRLGQYQPPDVIGHDNAGCLLGCLAGVQVRHPQTD